MTADERRLTDLVQDAAEMIEPTDRLTAIQARAAAETVRQRKRAWLVTGGASLATAAAVATVALVSGLPGVDRSGQPDPADSPSVSTPTALPSATESTKPDPGPGVAVPVYYVGDTPLGPRLYREFHRVDEADPVVAAAREASDGTPEDPDYRTLWPSDLVTSVETSPDGEYAVYLAGAAGESMSSGLSPAEAELAIQALVYTIQGAGGSTDPVRFYADSRPLTKVLGVETGGAVTRAPQLDVLALVNVTTPEQGSTLIPGTITASGVASSFEATVPWEILDATGNQVLQGFATAEGWAERLYPWETEIDVSGLAPGDYVFVARTDDPSAGEGPGAFEDTKDFTLD